MPTTPQCYSDMDKRPMRVLISGGGTGGHIFPALSIAEALKRRDADTEILFVGAQGRMEMEKVPAAGYEIIGLPVAGFDRKRLWRNVGVLIKLAKSLAKAKKVVRDFKPDIAVGVGGYASGPVLKQAQRRGIPTVLQEQNSYAGVTNKLLAKKAAVICTAYPDMERFFPADRIVLTGNPVRAALLECALDREEAVKSLGFDPARPLLFVTGGSLGARTINDSVAASLKAFEEAGVQLLWQTGKLYASECAQKAAPFANVKAMPFIADMATAYRAADLVVARAGAGTISELELLGKPAILIPSPNVAEDHQRKNAEALSSRGAAVMIADAEAVEKLAPEVTALIGDKAKLASLSAAAKSLAKEGSADAIAETICSIVKSQQK